MSLAAAACQASTTEQVTVDEAPLVNGTVTSGYRHVGYVGGCTGTLIGRRTAITAAHCVVHGGRASFCDYPSGVAFTFPSTCVEGNVQQYTGYGGGGDFADDAALILLDHDFTSITGIVPTRIGGPPTAGSLFHIVGYGCTNRDTGVGGGTKRTGVNFIQDVDSGTIEYDNEAYTYGCPGDSGAPTYFPSTDCQFGMHVGKESIFTGSDYQITRLDNKLFWIFPTANDASIHPCGLAVCGDGLCQSPEGCSTCPGDCGACPPCGDGVCSASESCGSCSADCGPCCGNGQCEPGENSDSCLEDCPVSCPIGRRDCCLDGLCRTPTQCQHVGCDF